MQRLLLIANPSSSQFTGGGHRTVVRILSRRFDVEPAWPQSADHARQLTAQAVADGFDVVAAMGGDGVVHHVAHVLTGTETALGVVPTGTTNVFARLLGIPPKPNPAAKLLAGPHERHRTSLLALNGVQEGREVRRHAIFAAGFGFDATVVARAEKEPYRKYHFGGLHYARTAVSTLFGEYRKRKPHVQVHAAGHQAHAVAVLIQFRRIYTYFGRLPLRFSPELPAPLSVLVVEALPARRVGRIGAAVLGGADLDDLPGMSVWTGLDSLNLEADPPVAGQADGESTGSWQSALVVLQPEALQVVVPPSSRR